MTQRLKLPPDFDALILEGESSYIEFKNAQVNPVSLAEEIVAFANSDGGTILIGIEDDGAISGVDARDMEMRVVNICRNAVRPSLIPHISKKIVNNLVILIVEIDSADTVHCTVQGKYFIRVGSTKQSPTQQELLRLFQKRRMITFDETPVLQAGIASIDLGKVDAYLLRMGASPLDIEDADSTKKDLLNLSILSPVDLNHPSLAGYLSFGRHPQKVYPSYTIMAGAYAGVDVAAATVREKEITGAFDDLIEDTMAFFKLTLPQTVKMPDGIRREDHYGYPITALREAVVNAIAHRDYTISGSAIRIFVFENQVEIRSPGGLCNTMTLESLPYRQFTRNQNIASFLSGLGYMERRGKGILRMKKLAQEYDLDCRFSLTPDQSELVVCFGVCSSSAIQHHTG
jgi:ATP-dependent DNA helicase RecG